MSTTACVRGGGQPSEPRKRGVHVVDVEREGRRREHDLFPGAHITNAPAVGFVRRFKTRVVRALSNQTLRNVQKTYFTCIACGYGLWTLRGGVQTTRKEMEAHIKGCDMWKRYEREHAAFLAQGKEGP